MTGSHTPQHGFAQERAWRQGIEQRLAALERQQQQVFTDPTGVSGDPAHGHAVVVLGSLKAICGISAFGLAVWNGSGWTQIT